MTFDHPWALLSGARCRWSGRRGSGAGRRAAWRSLLKAGAFAAHRPGAVRPAPDGVPEQGRRGACWWTRPPASRRTTWQAESAFADRVERARGGNWSHVMPFARTTRAAAQDEQPKNGWAAAPYGGRRRPRHRSGSRHSRRRGRPARRHGAAPPADLRRQREPGQRRARHLAGAATGHSHRHRAAGRTPQTRPAARVRRHSRARSSAASASPSKSRVEAPRAAARRGGDDRRRQDPSAPASVDLAAGVNHLRLQASVNAVGAIALAGKITASGLGEARFEDAVTLRGPRVLLVSRDPAVERGAPRPRRSKPTSSTSIARPAAFPTSSTTSS